MGPKRFYSQNFSIFIVKFKKLGFSAPLNQLKLKTKCLKSYSQTQTPTKRNVISNI